MTETGDDPCEEYANMKMATAKSEAAGRADAMFNSGNVKLDPKDTWVGTS